MEGFIHEANNYEVSKIMSCSVSFILSLTWVIDILFEKVSPEIGFEIEIHFLHTASRSEDFMQCLSSFLMSLVVTCTLMPWL